MTTLSEMKTLAEGYIRDGRIRREDGAAIIKQVPQAIELIEKMAEALLSMNDLINESQGVSGLHLNGDIATWDELLDGAYSDWLEKLPEALAIAKGDSVVIKAVLSDDDYNKAVSKSRKFLEMGMFFGEDPVEQIVHIVHKVLIEAAQEDAKDE